MQQKLFIEGLDLSQVSQNSLVGTSRVRGWLPFKQSLSAEGDHVPPYPESWCHIWI